MWIKVTSVRLSWQGQEIVQDQRWFGRTAAVSDQAAQHIDKEISGTAVVQVLDLRDVR